MISLILIALASSRVALANALSLEANLRRQPSNMKLREQTANAYAAERNFPKVSELLNAYTDQLSDPGFLLLASSYSAAKDYVNEVRILKIIASRQDEAFQWHMLLGSAYLKQASATGEGERRTEIITDAIGEFRRTLQINRKYKPAFDSLLNVLLDQKNNNEARELLVEGIQKFGDRPELYREVCRLDALDGFLVQAVEHCRTSIGLSPNFPDHYVYLTQALQDQEEMGAAEKEIVGAARRFPRNEFVQWAAGTMFFRRKNFPVAARYFRAAVDAAPTEGRSRYGLAQSLFSAGQEKEALDQYKIACKTVPESLETFLSSGSRLKQKGNVALGSAYISAANGCELQRDRAPASAKPQ